jgi:hypothetical protein
MEVFQNLLERRDDQLHSEHGPQALAYPVLSDQHAQEKGTLRAMTAWCVHYHGSPAQFHVVSDLRRIPSISFLHGTEPFKKPNRAAV